MSEQLPEMLPVPVAVDELRGVMKRARESSWSNISTQHEIDSVPANTEFARGFLDILPVKPYRTYGNSPASHFVVTKAADVGPSLVYGASMQYRGYQRVGFVIGESTPKGKGAGATQELLMLGWNGQTDDQTTAPLVWTLRTLRERWVRRQASNEQLLVSRPDNYDPMRFYRESLNGFILPDERGNKLANFVARSEPFMSIFPFRNLATKSLGVNNLQADSVNDRVLRNDDFERMNIMYRMELIAAAYGVGKEFDKVKARRYAALPKDPEVTYLGVPADYRQTVELASTHHITPPVSL